MRVGKIQKCKNMNPEDNSKKKKIQSFKDLDVWRECHKLAIVIYEVIRKLPKEEMFGMTSQMRRCSISIPSNIVEGFSRESYKEKMRFYAIARGSLAELESQILLVKDVGLISKDSYQGVTSIFSSARRLMNAFIRKTKELSRCSS